MNTVQILTQVRMFLSDPGNWTQKQMRDDNRRCLVAAIFDVVGQDEQHPVFKALQDNSNLAYCGISAPTSIHIVAGLNDRCTHEELLTWLDRTIVAEKAKRGVEALKCEIRTIPITAITKVVEPGTKTKVLVT